MLFPTGEFAVFFVIAFVAAWSTIRLPQINKIILLIFSYIFYSYWDWRFSFLLAESSMANYLFAIWIEGLAQQTQRRRALWVACIFNLGVLATFKYSGFFLSSLRELLQSLGLSRDFRIIEAILPVGISFFTFQGLSYVIDVYRREIKAHKSPIDILLYNAFFPHLIAGPIVRAKDFLPQLAKPPDYNNIYATRAFVLIAIGLFKKVVVAHYLAVHLVGPIFESPRNFSTLDLILGAYGYALQIYCDFSAYSDIAIGIAYLFGYEFKKNFNQPYKADSLSDFWKRWHISLSSFLRDYLYIPLGGSRRSAFCTYRNLLITMILGGLWHGAGWNFVIWGTIHGLGLTFEKFLANNIGVIPNNGFGRIARIIVVFHFVCFAWIFFNSESLANSREYFTAMTAWSYSSAIISPFVLTILTIGVLGQFVPANLPEKIERWSVLVPLPLQGALLGFVVVIISALGPGTLAPFIYFKF